MGPSGRVQKLLGAEGHRAEAAEADSRKRGSATGGREEVDARHRLIHQCYEHVPIQEMPEHITAASPSSDNNPDRSPQSPPATTTTTP